jgi:hypothetical protein
MYFLSTFDHVSSYGRATMKRQRRLLRLPLLKMTLDV